MLFLLILNSAAGEFFLKVLPELQLVMIYTYLGMWANPNFLSQHPPPENSQMFRRLQEETEMREYLTTSNLDFMVYVQFQIKVKILNVEYNLKIYDRKAPVILNTNSYCILIKFI